MNRVQSATRKIKFGQYLRSVRKAAGITLEALGEQVDLSKSHLSNIERGERGIPSPAILQKLAKPLGVMYSDLMVKAGYYSEATQEDIVTKTSANWDAEVMVIGNEDAVNVLLANGFTLSKVTSFDNSTVIIYTLLGRSQI